MKNIMLSLMTTLLLASCENNHMLVFETKKIGGISPVSKSTVGFNQVKSIFEAKCLMCHNGSTHPKNWTNYDTAKGDLVKLNDRLFITANMPSVGSLNASEKALIKSWISSGGPLVASADAPTTPLPNPTPEPIPSVSGEQIVQNKCLGCHGSDAAGLDTPVIHGLSSDYLTLHLNNFKTDARKDLVMGGAMNGVAQSLSEDEVSSVVTYLKSQSNCNINVLSEPGSGNIEAGMGKAQVCLGCHTDTPTIGPVIEGQKTGYIKASLNNFRAGKRIDNMMNAMAESLSDEDISDLAAYFNSKRNCK